MLGQTNLLSKTASRIQPSDSWGTINRFVPTYPYGVGLALITNAAKYRLLKKLLNFDNFGFQSIEEVNVLFTILINTVWCDRSATGGPRVVYAARGWVDKSVPLKPSYAQVVQKVYKDVVNQIDYGTKNVRAEVNYWAHKETSGLITNLVPERYSNHIDPTTLVFASTLYFKGTWKLTFDPSQTKYHEFYTYDGASVQVPYMTIKNNMQHLRHVDKEPVPFSVLSLPYRQGQDSNFTMLIFLPKARDGLPDLMNQISGNEHKYLEYYYPYQQVEVDNLVIPRFKASEGDADPNVDFLLASSCPPYDLTGMVEPPLGRKFNSSFNFDRCVIEVNEEGTTVAGAVADFVKQKPKGSTPPLVLKTTSTPAGAAKKLVSASTSVSTSLATTTDGKFNFIADHPFFLFIVEKKHKVTKGQHDVVGFMGFVVNPLNTN